MCYISKLMMFLYELIAHVAGKTSFVWNTSNVRWEASGELSSGVSHIEIPEPNTMLLLFAGLLFVFACCSNTIRLKK